MFRNIQGISHNMTINIMKHLHSIYVHTELNKHRDIMKVIYKKFAVKQRYTPQEYKSSEYV